ncbi:hypothetical protein V7266_17310 [Neobacillus drentensis]|uniref:hypothetical protein n=1 Tax=Neobacillus drentensis TaxID=220684 RepID=UPI00300025AF
MLDFLVGFVRGIAAMSPIWFVLFLIFSNVGKTKVESVRLQKYPPEKDKTHLS